MTHHRLSAKQRMISFHDAAKRLFGSNWERDSVESGSLGGGNSGLALDPLPDGSGDFPEWGLNPMRCEDVEYPDTSHFQLVALRPHVEGATQMCSSVLAMAGPAEAGLFMAMTFVGGILFVSAILVFVGLVSHSLIASILGLLGCGVAFIFFDPIGPFLMPPSNDPDMMHWMGNFQALGAAWGIITLAAIFSSTMSLYLKARKRIIPGDQAKNISPAQS